MEALNNVDFSMSMPSTTSLVFSIAMLVIAAVVLYKLFEKAGVPSWKALIPFYNIYTLYEISWGNGFYCLLLLIPIVNFIAMGITAYKLLPDDLRRHPRFRQLQVPRRTGLSRYESGTIPIDISHHILRTSSAIYGVFLCAQSL